MGTTRQNNNICRIYKFLPTSMWVYPNRQMSIVHLSNIRMTLLNNLTWGTICSSNSSSHSTDLMSMLTPIKATSIQPRWPAAQMKRLLLSYNRTTIWNSSTPSSCKRCRWPTRGYWVTELEESRLLKWIPMTNSSKKHRSLRSNRCHTTTVRSNQLNKRTLFLTQ